jgi:DNA invertase Pin-like site-specific DNA recombinase
MASIGASDIISSLSGNLTTLPENSIILILYRNQYMTMDAKMLDIGTRCVTLVRVSTPEQCRKDQLGISSQRQQLQEYIDHHQLAHEHEFKELGVSGRRPLDKRPELLEAVATAISKHAHIIVAKQCRLARDPLVLMTIEAQLNRHNLRIISVAGEGTEDDSPASILMRRILVAVAENEAAMCSIRTKAALKVLKDNNKLYHRPPFGFTTDGKGGLKATADAGSVLTAVLMRLDGQPLRAIAQELDWNIDKSWRITKRWIDNPDELAGLVANAPESW